MLDNFMCSCFIQLVNESFVMDFRIEIIQSQRLAGGQMNDFESGKGKSALLHLENQTKTEKRIMQIT